MMLGFAAGVTLSAALCSLLAPSIAEAKKQDLPFPAFARCVVSFFFRCLLILLLDILIPLFLKRDQAGALEEQKRRTFKLSLAIAIHNIPEGAACELVFGHGLKATGAAQTTAIRAAVGLSIGIGVQNIPEGAAVALSVRELTGRSVKGFLSGVLSGAMEPFVAGLALVMTQFLTDIDPWALGFWGPRCSLSASKNSCLKSCLGRVPDSACGR
jgi:ZIP family zinc transporter